MMTQSMDTQELYRQFLTVRQERDLWKQEATFASEALHQLRKLVHGTMPRDHGWIRDKLRQIAEKSVSIDASDEARAYLLASIEILADGLNDAIRGDTTGEDEDAISEREHLLRNLA